MNKQFTHSALSYCLLAIMFVSSSVSANFSSPFSDPEERPLLFSEGEMVELDKPAQKSHQNTPKAEPKVSKPKEVEVKFNASDLEDSKARLEKIKRDAEEAKKLAIAKENEAKRIESDLAKKLEQQRQEETKRRLELERAEKARLERIRVEELNKARLEKERIEREFQEAKAREREEARQKEAAEREKKRKLAEQRLQEMKAQAEAKARAEQEARERAKAEAEARKKLEAERLAKVAAEKAEADRLAKVAAEAKAKAEADRLAKIQAQKAEAAFKAKQDADAQAKRLAEEQRLANIQAEKLQSERLAKAEADRLAALAVKSKETSLSAATQFGVVPTSPTFGAVYAGPTYANRAAQSALQKATSKIAVDPAKMPLRNRVLGFTATKDQIESLNSRYQYDPSRMSIMPKQIGDVRLLPIARLTGDTIAIFNSSSDKQIVEEYLSYHPLHSQVFSNYVKRVMTMNGGETGGISIDKALMEELTYNFATTPIRSTSLKNAQDEYLYITSRLNDADQIKFWNWVNTVKTGDEIKVPAWIGLADAMYSQ